MKPILILKTGSTFQELARHFGDFEDWIITASGEAPGLFCVADGVEEPLPSPAQLAGVIVTGSHLMVSDGGELVGMWTRLLREALRLRLPVLGICYGHQLLAHALGGRVDNHPGGLELGQVEIEMVAAAQDDPLFQLLPPKFPAYASHRQSVLHLPEGAFVYASNAFEPHHAVRYAPNAWGVQFHPEFTQPIMRAYIEHFRPQLGGDVEVQQRLARVEELPAAGRLLQRFCQLIG